MKAKTASLAGKIIAAVIILTSWIGNQFFGMKFPIDEAVKAAGSIALIFTGIDLNLLAEKFRRGSE